MNELDDDPWATAAPTASVSQPYQRYSGYIGTFNSNDESGLEYTGASVAAVHEEGDDQGWPQHQQPQEQQPRSMPPVAAQQQQYEEQQQQRQPAHEDEDEDEDEDLTHSRNLVDDDEDIIFGPDKPAPKAANNSNRDLVVDLIAPQKQTYDGYHQQYQGSTGTTSVVASTATSGAVAQVTSKPISSSAVALGLGEGGFYGTNQALPLLEQQHVAMRIAVHTRHLKVTNKLQLLKALEGRTVDINLPDGNGYTALHSAATIGDETSVHFFLSHGAHVNAQTRRGYSPLMFACMYGHRVVVQMLLDAGANVHLRRANGASARDLAAHPITGFPIIVKILDEYGALPNSKYF